MRRLLLRLLRERGAAAAGMFALATPMLLGGIGFTVDGGLIRVDRARLQAAADAAALGGAEVIATPTNVAPTAQALATSNIPARGTVLAAGDVETGTWDAAHHSFTAGGASPTAVAVTTRLAAANGNAHALLFGPFVGLNTIDLSARAVAVSKTVETGCNPDYRYNFNNYVPSSSKIVTQGESTQVNGRATYLETTDGHPIVRLDNSANGQATVVIRISGAPGGDQLYTFNPPAQGSFRTEIPTITDTAPYPATNMTLVFTTVSVSAGTKGGGTSTWTNNIRKVDTLPGTCVPIPGAVNAGTHITGKLVG